MRPGSSPGHLELLTVQSLVEEVLERLWHSRYVVSLTVEEKKEEETGEDEQSHIKKAPICIEHTVNHHFFKPGINTHCLRIFTVWCAERPVENVCSRSDQFSTRPHGP